MFQVVLPPWVIASAMATAEERPENAKKIGRHNPPAHQDADLWGALSEHAFAFHHRINPQLISTAGNDGGIDFDLGDCTVDIKSSGVHPDSWVVAGGDLRADWYVFAYVQLPDKVIFKGKARREDLEKLPKSDKVPGKRLVKRADISDISPEDFRGKTTFGEDRKPQNTRLHQRGEDE